MNKNTLAGVRVIITRAEHQADALVEGVRLAGGEPVRFPAISIVPLATARMSWSRARARALKAGDWAIFTSPNAVRFTFDFMSDALPPGLQFAAVGEGTAAALKRRGVARVVIPPDGFGSEKLLQAPGLQKLARKKVCIFKGLGGRRLLRKKLEQRGAKVANAPVYQRERAHWERQALSAMIRGRAKLVMLVTSGEIMSHLMALMDAATYARLQQSPLVVPGARLAGMAKFSGFQRITVAEGVDTDSLLAALARAGAAR